VFFLKVQYQLSGQYYWVQLDLPSCLLTSARAANSMKVATLFTDGGARGNPGPAGIGFVLSQIGSMPFEYGQYIGHATNNQAEYRALIAGMQEAKKQGIADLKCFLDSELVVKQVRGEYRVKNEELKILLTEIKKLLPVFSSVTFEHVPRSKNAIADRLVNEALDA
jgi:ribonuclease HI